MLFFAFNGGFNMIAQGRGQIADKNRQEKNVAQILQLTVHHNLEEEYLVTEANTRGKGYPSVVLPRKLLMPLPLLQRLAC